MEILFNLEYKTASGEELVLNVLQENDGCRRCRMQTHDGEHWQVRLSEVPAAGACLDYYYSVWREQEECRHEWLTAPHRLELTATQATGYTVFDHWIDIPDDAPLYSSAFVDCVLPRKIEQSEPTAFSRTVRLKVRAPQLLPDERLAIVGAPEYLGAWDANRALPMTEHQPYEWVAALDADHLPGMFEFKFVKLVALEHSTSGANWEYWEQGGNRYVDLPELSQGGVAVYELPQARFDAHPWKGAGTVVPVFSLRSEGSFGVGDFGDLKLMIDWCDKTYQRVLQVLPINDTNQTGTWEDSYPYNAISVYALHPQYADLRQLPPLNDEQQRARFEALRQELNALPQIDYERMMAAKMEYLRLIYKQEARKVVHTKGYRQFVEQNREWLEPYARFYSENGATDEPTFWYYVQYVLDQQMRAAHDHARAHRVILKGDIPIGVNRNGADVLAEPRYFNLDGQAGAPPDAFAEEGQNWGFPTYNWDAMLADGCQWWVRRFSKMAEYFDAYRIDHVLGFFRIWEIPMPEKSGLYGQFQPSLPLTEEELATRWQLPFRRELYLEDHRQKNTWHPRINAPKLEAFRQLPEDEQQRFWDMYNDYFYRRNNQFWYEEAMKKLPRLTQATRMLCCAEDLGMVPDCVSWVMDKLRILSLEIQSMPKEPGLRFGKLSHNPYRSVCTISTHDMETLRQWWDEDPERTQDYYKSRLRRNGNAPHPLPGWLAKDIVSRFLTSPSMLCLISLQDWLSISEKLRLPDASAERINIPVNPRHYWRYRMHLTLEQLLQADELNAEIQQLVSDSGRR